MKTTKPWEHFVGDVSEFCSAGVKKLFKELGVEVEDDDMLEFTLLTPDLIEITHLGSGEKVGITDKNPSQPPLAPGARVW